jgi:hypothetical protein
MLGRRARLKLKHALRPVRNERMGRRRAHRPVDQDFLESHVVT